jgi:ribonuclease-3
MTLEKFQQYIEVTFQDQSLLTMAFVHRSALNEDASLKEHNERLEFLGDAVLELITTEYLYLHFQKNEGELTNLRSAMVKRETLAEVARDLHLGDMLFLSKGERKSGGQEKDYILANTVEAVIGAMYLDQGYAVVRKFVYNFLIVKLKAILENKSYIDHKTLFQEKSQELLSVTPHYKLLFEEGPDHDKVFTMGVYLGEEFIAQGKGSSKQSAEQEAASAAVAFKKWTLA